MTPDFHIVVDKHQDVTAAIRNRLLFLRVTDEASYTSDALEIGLDDRGGAVQMPRRGVELQVELGYSVGGKLAGLERDSSRVLMGRYVVDEVEFSDPPATLIIRGSAADLRGDLKDQRTRSWSSISINDLVTSIAVEHGLEPRVTKELAGIVLPHFDQIDESDMNLLTRLGERYGAVAKPVGGYLAFVKRGAGMSVSAGPVTGANISRYQVSDWRVTLADRPRYRSAKAHWYDKAAARRETVTVGDGKPAYSLRETYADKATALSAAQAALDRLERGGGTLRLTLKPGLPTISAESPINVTGFRNGINGRWIATRVIHELSGGGYSTQVEAETPTGK